MKTKKLKTGFYGKLPFHKEYIRTGDIRSETRVLENFLHSGQSEQKSRAEETEAPPRSLTLFLFSPPKGRRILAGTLQPSTDGLRSFPIAHFGHLRRRAVAKNYFLLPLLLEAFWEASDAFLARTFSGVQDFQDQHASLHITVPSRFSSVKERFQELMNRHTVQGLSPPSATEDDGGGEPTLRWFTNLRTVAGIERPRNRREGVSLAFWLPVHGTREERLFLAAFWMRVLDVVLDNPRPLPSVFVTDRGKDGYRPGVFIVFRPLRSSDFVCIMEGRPRSDTITDVTADWGNVGRETVLPGPLDQGLRSPETTVAEILAILQNTC